MLFLWHRNRLHPHSLWSPDLTSTGQFRRGRERRSPSLSRWQPPGAPRSVGKGKEQIWKTPQSHAPASCCFSDPSKLAAPQGSNLGTRRGIPEMGTAPGMKQASNKCLVNKECMRPWMRKWMNEGTPKMPCHFLELLSEDAPCRKLQIPVQGTTENPISCPSKYYLAI